jgi:predicted nuclease of predicted toxin-antitoxin system
MKILLDENLPVKLKQTFGNLHTVFSVREMGWSGKKNGELLKLMTTGSFDGLVTMDKNLSSQQNLQKYSITVFVLNGINNKLKTLENLIPLLLKEIEAGAKPGITVISL